mgnify:CR=1 FL=1
MFFTLLIFPKYFLDKVNALIGYNDDKKILQGINDTNLALSKAENEQYRVTLLYFLSNVHYDLYYKEAKKKGLKAIPQNKNLQEAKRLLNTAIEESNDPDLRKQFFLNMQF